MGLDFLLVFEKQEVGCDLKRERAQLRSALADAVMKFDQQKKETADAVMKLEQSNRKASATQVQKETEQVQKLEKGRRLLVGLSVVVAIAVFFMHLG